MCRESELEQENAQLRQQIWQLEFDFAGCRGTVRSLERRLHDRDDDVARLSLRLDHLTQQLDLAERHAKERQHSKRQGDEDGAAEAAKREEVLRQQLRAKQEDLDRCREQLAAVQRYLSDADSAERPAQQQPGQAADGAVAGGVATLGPGECRLGVDGFLAGGHGGLALA